MNFDVFLNGVTLYSFHKNVCILLILVEKTRKLIWCDSVMFLVERKIFLGKFDIQITFLRNFVLICYNCYYMQFSIKIRFFNKLFKILLKYANFHIGTKNSELRKGAPRDC